MQPTRTQVPPRADSRSTSATSKPSCAARMAATYPPGPAPMMTMSCCAGALPTLPFASLMRWSSHFQEHAGGVLDGFLDALQEGHRLAAVHHAVVVGHGQVHHGPDDHLAIHGHGALLDAVHAQHAALRRVDDG